MRKALYILLGIVALCSTVRADKYVGRVVSDKGEPIGYATVYPSAPLTFLQPPPHPAPRDLDPPTAARPLPPDPSAKQPEQSFLSGSLLEYLVSLPILCSLSLTPCLFFRSLSFNSVYCVRLCLFRSLSFNLVFSPFTTKIGWYTHLVTYLL